MQKDNKNIDDYSDIIDMPHHVSLNHPQMSMSCRAAQFGAFQALEGYEEAINEASKNL